MNRLLVQDLMRACTDAIVDESMPLRHAAERLISLDLGVLIAVGSDGRICGIVPESAIIRQLLTNSSREQTITEILSRHVETTRPDTEVDSILHLFRSSCHTLIPVVAEDGHVVGSLHRADVVRMLLDSSGGSDSSLPAPHAFRQRRDINQSPGRPDSDSDTVG